MKNKILVEILVPSINETFNLFLPINKSVGEIIKLLNLAINELSDGEFPIKDDLSLINMYDGSIYSFDHSLKDNRIKNGSRLALI